VLTAIRIHRRLRSDRPSHALILLCLLAAGSGAAPAEWRALEPGLDLATFPLSQDSDHGDSRITILRIDPVLWDLEFAGISEGREHSNRSARRWCQTRGFTAAINAGMFATDYRTHVGYLRFRDHVNSGHVNVYQSVAAFDPLVEDLARFRIWDLDVPGVTMDSVRTAYGSVVQNLRLIKRPAENRWKPIERRWSEAALGEDDEGRILFIFCRSPLSMHDLNEELLGLDIGLVCAQHLEGGPEAQMYLRAGGVETELVGSFETAFRENDANNKAWPIPNVLGIHRRIGEESEP
jgi:hypothetical protein